MATKIIALILLALAGCDNSVCARKSDCKQGLVCSAQGMCVTAPDGGDGSTDPVTDGGVSQADGG